MYNKLKAHNYLNAVKNALELALVIGLPMVFFGALMYFCSREYDAVAKVNGLIFLGVGVLSFIGFFVAELKSQLSYERRKIASTKLFIASRIFKGF